MKMATRKKDACEFGEIEQNSNFVLKYDNIQQTCKYLRYVFVEVINITLWAILIFFNFNNIYNTMRNNNIAKIKHT